MAFDGLGYGADSTIWGGEFLVADLAGFERAGHLQAVPMPGGTAAVKEPWRMAAAWLDAAFEGDPPADLDIVRRNGERWAQVVRMAKAAVNTPATSSAGRLFDAMASLAGVRDSINYEGQAAIELEQASDPTDAAAYPVEIEDGPELVLSALPLVRAVVDDVRAGVGAAVIGARFHNGLARAVIDACAALRERTGLATVALSGGVFQNQLLLDRAVTGLEQTGFRVLVHSQVPPNDGGISLGQVAVAGAQ